MELTEILIPDAVRVSNSISSKKRLLQEISELSADLNRLPGQKIFEALQERELLGATGMGKGIGGPGTTCPGW